MSSSRRINGGGSLRSQIFQSEKKLKAFQLLLEELAQPEVDVAEISHHTTTVVNMIRQQNIMMIPKILDHIKKQSEPLVLEISRRKQTKRLEKAASVSGRAPMKTNEEVPSTVVQHGSLDQSSHSSVVTEEVFQECPNSVAPAASMKVEEIQSSVVYDEPFVDPPVMRIEESTDEEKQFEIIFSDSTRQLDVDNGNHIVHSITERTAEHSGTVNVPNSFPLFQLVHTGDVPEDVQQEIVKLIRQANPQLDLNSITFNFKSPQTVEIIANVNS